MNIQFDQYETLSEFTERFLVEAHVLLGASILTTEDVGIAMTAAVKPYQELYNTMSHVLDRDTGLIGIMNASHRLSAMNSAPNVAQKPSVAPAPSLYEYRLQRLVYQPLEHIRPSYESVDPLWPMYASPVQLQPGNLTGNFRPGLSSPNYICARFMNICFQCRQRGHYAANCPSKPQVYTMPTKIIDQGKAGVE